MNPLVATALVAGARWTERLPGPTIESPEEGSPGFAGFVATFLLAAAIIVLAVSFTRRMRRADHRERLRASAEPPRGAAAGPPVASADDPAGDASPGADPGAPPGHRTDDGPR